MANTTLTVKTTIDQPIQLVWNCLTQATHITNWNFAHPSWHCPKAALDLKVGGTFNYRMEARDGSAGFDLTGSFTLVESPTHLQYRLDDGRMVNLHLSEQDGRTHVLEHFEAETQNSLELQQQGWQAILDQFAIHCHRQTST